MPKASTPIWVPKCLLHRSEFGFEDFCARDMSGYPAAVRAFAESARSKSGWLGAGR